MLERPHPEPPQDLPKTKKAPDDEVGAPIFEMEQAKYAKHPEAENGDIRVDVKEMAKDRTAEIVQKAEEALEELEDDLEELVEEATPEAMSMAKTLTNKMNALLNRFNSIFRTREKAAQFPSPDQIPERPAVNTEKLNAAYEAAKTIPKIPENLQPQDLAHGISEILNNLPELKAKLTGPVLESLSSEFYNTGKGRTDTLIVLDVMKEEDVFNTDPDRAVLYKQLDRYTRALQALTGEPKRGAVLGARELAKSILDASDFASKPAPDKEALPPLTKELTFDGKGNVIKEEVIPMPLADEFIEPLPEEEPVSMAEVVEFPGTTGEPEPVEKPMSPDMAAAMKEVARIQEQIDGAQARLNDLPWWKLDSGSRIARSATKEAIKRYRGQLKDAYFTVTDIKNKDLKYKDKSKDRKKFAA